MKETLFKAKSKHVFNIYLWEKVGDFPNDYPYRKNFDEGDICDECERNYNEHGEILNDLELIKVCPGDYIAQNTKDPRHIFVVSRKYFEDNFEIVS